MQYNLIEPSIYMPTSLADALGFKEQHPDTTVYAGGTYLLWNQASRLLLLPKSILSLQNIKELNRLGRTETRLDVGAMVSFQRILRAGPKVLSPLLVSALECVCPPSVATMATLGGNLSVPDRCMASFPVMHVLDARCEIKSSKRTRWVPVTGLRSPTGELQLEPIELITRIQIPMEEWNFYIHRRIGSFSYGITADSLIMVIVGKTYRGMLTEFRFALGNFTSRIYRNRDLETLLIGTRLPIGKSKDLKAFLYALQEDLQTQKFLSSHAQLDRVLYILQSTLANPFQYSA
ncbi:MAG: FAD binding domain-containing protein [Spirochaetes bacterium]|nr:FAD binding domain-containing protein [Spirochaetota bacterium]